MSAGWRDKTVVDAAAGSLLWHAGAVVRQAALARGELGARSRRWVRRCDVVWDLAVAPGGRRAVGFQRGAPEAALDDEQPGYPLITPSGRSCATGTASPACSTTRTTRSTSL